MPHFSDKREVLFDGEVVVRAALTTAVAAAPAGLGPLEILLFAFRSFQPMLEEQRAYAKPRQDVISATAALQERELTKIAALADALADALRKRGVSDLRAVLAAQAGLAAFVHATLAWLDDPEMDLGARIDVAFRELRGILAQKD